MTSRRRTRARHRAQRAAPATAPGQPRQHAIARRRPQARQQQRQRQRQRHSEQRSESHRVAPVSSPRPISTRSSGASAATPSSAERIASASTTLRVRADRHPRNRRLAAWSAPSTAPGTHSRRSAVHRVRSPRPTTTAPNRAPHDSSSHLARNPPAGGRPISAMPLSAKAAMVMRQRARDATQVRDTIMAEGRVDQAGRHEHRRLGGRMRNHLQ